MFSISRRKVCELLNYAFLVTHIYCNLGAKGSFSSLRNIIFGTSAAVEITFFAAPLSISTLPCICTLCITAHNTLHRPPSPSFRRRDFHESQTFVFCVPHCVTGGETRRRPPHSALSTFFPGGVAALAHFFTTKHALFRLIQNRKKLCYYFLGISPPFVGKGKSIGCVSLSSPPFRARAENFI